MTEFGGLECFWSDLDKHPKCPHGPTLLFGRHVNGELKQFYTCSACRDKKFCAFYVEKDAKLTEAQKKAWKEEAKKALPFYNHRRLFIRFNETMVESPEKRAYCHGCNKLVLFAERSEHANHDLQVGLSDEQMNNPTTVLKPLANVKKEAQYLFSKKATTEITNMLVKAGAEQVLCIGAPRIHEHITQHFEHKMSSLLLDFDGRFHNFFGPLSYCWYNLFNHHFFTDEAAQTFKDFITQNGGKNTFVVCDPPFGGRVESMSQTLKTISDQHIKLNGLKDPELELKIFFVFPYFMESIMQRKSNPPGVSGGLKDLRMADYKVDYENHPLFLTGSGGRKYGSPVRIFTNISLSLLELPAEDGYKFCGKCQKWISAENKHCKKCKACTSKDGRRYKHCDLCERCVKPTWRHCETCERCTLEKHTCGGKPRVSGRCFKCGESDHVEKDCREGIAMENGRKRKSKVNEMETPAKKQKTHSLKSTAIPIVKTGKNMKRKNKTAAVEPTELAITMGQTKGAEIIAKKQKIAVSRNAVTPTAKVEKKTKRITESAESVESTAVETKKKRKNLTNRTDLVVENGDTENPVALTAKEAKRLRRMMKKAPIEWVDVENRKKQKNESNGTGTLAEIERTKTANVEKKQKKRKNPLAKTIEEPLKKVLKAQNSTTSVRSKASKNVEKNAVKKRKIKRT